MPVSQSRRKEISNNGKLNTPYVAYSIDLAFSRQPRGPCFGESLKLYMHMGKFLARL